MTPAPNLVLGSNVTDARYDIKQCAFADFDDTCAFGASHLNLHAKADHSNYFTVKVSDYGKGGCVNPCVRGGSGGSKRRKREPTAVNEGIGESKRRKREPTAVEDEAVGTNRSKRALGINCRGSWCCEGLVPPGFHTPDKMEALLHNAKNPDRTYKSDEHIACIPTPSCATVSHNLFSKTNRVLLGWLL